MGRAESDGGALFVVSETVIVQVDKASCSRGRNGVDFFRINKDIGMLHEAKECIYCDCYFWLVAKIMHFYLG